MHSECRHCCRATAADTCQNQLVWAGGGGGCGNALESVISRGLGRKGFGTLDARRGIGTIVPVTSPSGTNLGIADERDFLYRNFLERDFGPASG